LTPSTPEIAAPADDEPRRKTLERLEARRRLRCSRPHSTRGKKCRLSDYKVPDRITFLSQPLPRNAAGKVLKGELRKMIEAEATA
jgi:acyl-CoA synthetase (AMP-forming)/AMP-acid ligase II